ncbi:MAG: M20 family metallopeptidase, partial [Kiritimatiellae bacterium]|nr:M20 family metallopeptidase [Kiritimatiellia bacterium]
MSSTACVSRIEALLPELTALRRDLHAHPELGFEEHYTAGRVAEWLGGLPDMRVRTGVAGTGVVATLAARKRGPCVALRADMDALPVDDACGQPYVSRHPGRAHACGHDGHVACLLGAARLLSEQAGQLAGPVRFIFQPAEEGGGGGEQMCRQGALEDPAPAAIFALHAWPFLPLGTVGVRAGAAMASTDAIDIVVRGRGAHAGTPHKGVDPIVAASHVVVALQTVVSRLTDPTETALVTIGSIAGGSARNVIPDTVTLSGTIRTHAEAQRQA